MQSLKKSSTILRKSNIVDATIVAAISLVSILIRGVSASYPLTINGFDSWYLFYNALLIAQAHGNWYAVPPDVHAWFPYGYFIELGDTIGLPFLVALFSLPFFSAFGANAVYTVTIFFDIALAGLGVAAAYISVSGITKSRIAGFIAAAVIAVSPALTYKNIIGGLPKDSWGGVFVLFSIYLLNYAIEKKKPLYGAIAGVPLFLAEITWGGSTYIDLSLLAGAFLLILLNRNDETTAKSFTLMAIVTAFLTSFAPNSIGFFSGLAHGFSLLLIGALLFFDVYLKQIIPREISESRTLILTAIIVLIIVIGILGLSFLGISPIPSRYYAIVNPFFQFTVPIDRTVAEYIPQSITSMIQDFGVALFLSIVGMYYLLRQSSLAGLWLLVLGVLSIYGTSEQPYLFNYTAYMIAPLAGIGVYFIVNKVREHGNKLIPLLILGIVGISLVADASAAIVYSYEPNEILTSASPYPITNYAWVSALDWLNSKTPEHSFVMSWWDYGYWVEVIGNRSVIDENNTLNGTQIKLMAEMFLNNESFAATVLEKDFHLAPYGSPNYTIPAYIVAYDAVTLVNSSTGDEWFIGYPTDLGGEFLGYTTSLGDIGKAFGAMTVIAGYPISEYLNSSLILQEEESLNSSLAPLAQTNPSVASELSTLESYVGSAYPFAWTQKAYQSLIANMFIEALQGYNGYPVIAPFSSSLSITSSGIQRTPGTPLEPVHLMYFQPVYVSLYPWITGPDYQTYIMVMIYQFVQPGTIINTTYVYG
ncbi:MULTISPECIES: STT3 domain-containing protein [Acidianus]|uniref:dolichyl-phosphooligosaccharide-protein glycotransferase n=1 Tax=Candidatus Acidianus copahuensis TaxID=1160895 RepID=A0A031LRB8_9CREN|nr:MULTISPECIES: STT3 domain-containing protein [Acidianus]EZQ06944.1 peptide transporter [Candidatus Acidianus copahuensis]NON63478.1 peptide transporter [Acidianus sp. RZ1]